MFPDMTNVSLITAYSGSDEEMSGSENEMKDITEEYKTDDESDDQMIESNVMEEIEVEDDEDGSDEDEINDGYTEEKANCRMFIN